jgi:hypothetical protein
MLWMLFLGLWKVSNLFLGVRLVIFNKLIEGLNGLWTKHNISWFRRRFLKPAWNSLKLSLVIDLFLIVLANLVFLVVESSLFIFPCSLVVVVIRIRAQFFLHWLLYHFPLLNLFRWAFRTNGIVRTGAWEWLLTYYWCEVGGKIEIDMSNILTCFRFNFYLRLLW